MKIRRDDLPGILTLTEIKTQIAIGALDIWDLLYIIDKYEASKYYLPEDVIVFLEEYLNTSIEKNKFYLRDEDSKNPTEYE